MRLIVIGLALVFLTACGKKDPGQNKTVATATASSAVSTPSRSNQPAAPVVTQESLPGALSKAERTALDESNKKYRDESLKKRMIGALRGDTDAQMDVGYFLSNSSEINEKIAGCGWYLAIAAFNEHASSTAPDSVRIACSTLSSEERNIAEFKARSLEKLMKKSWRDY